MRLITFLYGSLVACIAGSALACDLPKLMVVPPKDQVAGKEAALGTTARAYFAAMQAYSACNLAELTGAGGDAAPEVIKQVLVRRINAARAEEDFMMKLFTQNVGALDPGQASPPPAGR